MKRTAYQQHYKQQQRLQWKFLGLCTSCGCERDRTTGKWCKYCLDQHRERQERWKNGEKNNPDALSGKEAVPDL